MTTRERSTRYRAAIAADARRRALWTGEPLAAIACGRRVDDLPREAHGDLRERPIGDGTRAALGVDTNGRDRPRSLETLAMTTDIRRYPHLLLPLLAALAGACDEPGHASDDAIEADDDADRPANDPKSVGELEADSSHHGFVLVHGRPVRVTYQALEGRAIMGGDVDLGPVSAIAATAEEALAKLDAPVGAPRTMYDQAKLWPGGLVRFKLKPGLNLKIAGAARAAAAHYNQFTAETGVRFEEVDESYQGDHIRVVLASDPDEPSHCFYYNTKGVKQYVPCSESIGYTGGTQRIWLNIVDNISIWQVAAHEFGHALGQFHEHSRCERNEFITLAYKGAVEGPYCDLTTTEAYDTWSIMHYSEGEFAGRATFKPGVSVPPAKSVHPGLVDTDRRSLKKMYMNETAWYTSFSSGRCLDAKSGDAGTQLYVWGCYGPTTPHQQFFYNKDTGEFKVFGRCVDVPSGKRLDPVVIRDCDGSATQKWDVADLGRIQMRDQVDEQGRPMCLDIENQQWHQTAPIVLQYCHRGDNQVWQRRSAGVGEPTFNIKNDLGRCIDGFDLSNTGVPMRLWDCSQDDVDQRFRRNVHGELVAHESHCMDGYLAEPYDPAVMYSCWGGLNQKFQRDSLGRLVMQQDPSLCVDIADGQSYNGSSLQLKPCSDALSQRWTYVFPDGA